MGNIKVNIEKSPTPLLWIDTSILIKMAKSSLGEKISEQEKQQVQYLYDAIIKKTKDKKLICPEADQQEEIELGERLEKECREIQAKLSLGIEFIHRQGIEDLLISKFMKAYIDKDKEVNLTYKELFHGNPIEKLDEALGRQFIIDVHIPLSKEMLEKRKKIKRELPIKWETLRQEKIKAGNTFEQEKEMEFRAYLTAFLKLKRKYISGLLRGEFNVDDFLGAAGFMHYEKIWDSYKGEPRGLEGLALFFLSDYFKQIPTINIGCSLRARLATSPNPIKSGDYLDIGQISTVLPFFTFIITDRAMKNHIQSLGFHKVYNTGVLSMRDFVEVKKFIESL